MEIAGIPLSRVYSVVLATIALPLFTNCSTEEDKELPLPTATAKLEQACHSSAPSPCIYFVNTDVANPGNGRSWKSAFRNVQDGIDAAYHAAKHEDSCEVWVAEGTYYAHSSSPKSSIQLKKKVAVYGGFSGNETSRDDRDWKAHVTILDGSQKQHCAGNDDCDDCDGKDKKHKHCKCDKKDKYKKYVHHVVRGSSGATIDGFVITNGGGSTGKKSYRDGAGLYNVSQSPTIRNCVFLNNSAYDDGGAIYNHNASPRIENCLFVNNTAGGKGGAIYNKHSDPEIVNSVFSGNTSKKEGGAIFIYKKSNVTIVNSTFYNNYSQKQGGAVYAKSDGNAVIVGSIFWNNHSKYQSGEIYRKKGAVAVSYSLVRGGYPGAGNIDADPLFVNPSEGNLHLQPSSPCIDAANGDVAPEKDLEGRFRFDSPATPNTGIGTPDYVDMGAYEYSVGGDPCAGVSCDTPPSDYCLDENTLHVFDLPGVCNGGTCAYPSHEEECQFGCQEGACNLDPCQDVECNTPPANECADQDNLRVFEQTGSCADGVCSYDSSLTLCDFGCSDDVCIADPCIGISCNMPPYNVCENAETLRVFDPGGWCDLGTCQYGSQTLSCQFGCFNGACLQDPCAGISCNAPPANYCVDGSILRVHSDSGTCEDGDCEYSFVDLQCEFGCASGSCAQDPCLGIVCNNPPANYCSDTDTLIIHSDQGRCDEGICQYKDFPFICDFGCADGACTEDPCLGISCDNPPADYCADANTLIDYETLGICTDGSCNYTSNQIPCEFGCDSGECLPDPCSGVSCDTPPANYCSDKQTLMVYQIPGACDDGICTYPSTTENCPYGCENGQCRPSECLEGDCCDNGTLRPAGFVCREPAGDCDVAEICSGTDADCPGDNLASTGTVCRASAGDCDIAETCSGQSVDCPEDAFLSGKFQCNDTPHLVEYSCGSTQCGGDAMLREQYQFCSGSSASCGYDNLFWTKWRMLEDCAANEICQTDGNSASCAVCEFGCNDGACFVGSEPPWWPENTMMVATSVQPTSLSLVWTPAEDDLEVTAYRIFQNDTVIASETVNDLVTEPNGDSVVYIYPIEGLSPDTLYDFRVEAGDGDGNWSIDDPEYSITTPLVPDTTPPWWPSGSEMTVSSINLDGATLTWEPAEDDIGVQLYTLGLKRTTPGQTDFDTLGTVASDQLTFVINTPLMPDSTYSFFVLAHDLAGNQSVLLWSTPVCTSGDCCENGVLLDTSHECRGANGVCDAVETCNGGSAVCPVDGFASSAVVCRPADGDCDVADYCTGYSAECGADNFADAGITCRQANGICDTEEQCTGQSKDCPADNYAPSGQICRPAVGDCDVADACTGLSPACPKDRRVYPDTECRAAAGPCDEAEYCDGSSAFCPEDGFESAGTVCRISAGICDEVELCDGASASCPVDGFVSAGTECRAAEGPCDAPESCDGMNADCPADGLMLAGTICRSSNGVCDVAESCSGTDASCPADGYQAAGTECRSAVGDCDVAENCSGTSASCPTDGLVSAGTECRASAGDCDVSESCDGANPECPADGFVPSGTECRPSQGACDVAESCDGASSTCPADELVAAGVECRASAGDCDLAESCDGASATCPVDGFIDAGTQCRSSAGICDEAETCDGASANCPENEFVTAGTECRGSAGACDVAESCDGVGALCPSDEFVISGTECRASAGSCDVAESCDGASAECPEDVFKPEQTVCRNSEGLCDIAEECSGQSPVCPEDILAPADMLCNSEPVSVEYSCSEGSCGSNALKREQYSYCTGSDRICGNENLVWHDWEILDDCDDNSYCQADASSASCISCGCECSKGTCLETKQVDCIDYIPINATPLVPSAELSCNPDGTWSEPTDCEWVCNDGFVYREDTNECAESSGCIFEDQMVLGEPKPVDFVITFDNWLDNYFEDDQHVEVVKSNLKSMLNTIHNEKVNARFVLVSRKESGHLSDICLDPPIGGENCTNSDYLYHINEYVSHYIDNSPEKRTLFCHNENYRYQYPYDHVWEYEFCSDHYEHFLRRGSYKQLVIVTGNDSDYGAYDRWPNYSDDFVNIGFDHLVINAVSALYDDGWVSDCLNSNAGWNLQHRYSVSTTGGHHQDICSSDWAVFEQNIIDDVKEVNRKFFALSEMPVVDTIKVFLSPTSDGVRTEQLSNWIYDDNRNSIYFTNQGQFDPSSIVTIAYETFDSEVSCGDGMGECAQGGTKICINNEWTECEGLMLPSTEEICDSVDNDCDGLIDETCDCIEGETRRCGGGDDAVLPRHQSCLNGEWTECLSEAAFRDYGLEECALAHVDKNIEALSSLEVLDCTGQSSGYQGLTSYNHIGSLNGIEQLTSLRELNLHGHDVRNINSINALSSLETVEMTDNRIMGAVEVDGLTNLSILELDDNEIEALSLSNLPSLTYLNFDGNESQGIAFVNTPNVEVLELNSNAFENLTLPSFNKLRVLELQDNHNNHPWGGQSDDFTMGTLTMGDCPSLEELYLSWSRIDSLNMQVYPNLVIASLSTNNLTTISFNGFQSLVDLDLSANQLSEFSLIDVPALEELRLQDNLLVDVIFEDQPELTYLSLDRNALTDLYIPVMPKLERLSITGNYIQSLELRGVSQLRYLYADGNPIESIYMTGGQRLSTVRIGDCAPNGTITLLGDQSEFVFYDCSLAECVLDESDGDVDDLLTLTSLNCDYRGIKDLRGIEGLQRLRSVYLRNNQISDASPLNELPNLAYVYLDNNPLVEVCDGVDNNYDGEVDEGCCSTYGEIRSCTHTCGIGTQRCVDGHWTECSGPSPSTEVCDGIDNDCDGSVDENVQGEGISCCGTGLTSCSDGVLGCDSCSEPPTDYCIDSNILRKYSSLGTCDNGQCTYSYEDRECQYGCNNGVCEPGPCQCDNPPSDRCVDSEHFRMYEKDGQCVDGTCIYQQREIECSGGCSNGTCITSVCDLIDCGENSQCNVEDETAVCSCLPGYVLENDECMIPVQCIDYECEENSTCVLIDGNPECLCNEGFVSYMDRCVADPCHGIYCSGHGHCDIITETFSPNCICESGYLSSVYDCFEDPCAEPNVCPANKVCNVNGEEASCECPTGYDGENCENCSEFFHREGDNCVPDQTEMPIGCEDVEDWPEEYVAIENEIIRQTNEARKKTQICGEYGVMPPAPPLRKDPNLICAARRYAKYSAERNHFSHIDQEGNGPQWRAEQTGYTYGVSENLAGASTPQNPIRVVSGWLFSDGHCRNLMDPSRTDIGIGYSTNPSNDDYKYLYVQKFGVEDSGESCFTGYHAEGEYCCPNGYHLADGYCVEDIPCTLGECCENGFVVIDGRACGDQVIDEEFMCSGMDCGSDVLRRQLRSHCDGTSPTCENNDPQWSEWSVAQSCYTFAYCETDGTTAWCESCEYGCAEGSCNQHLPPEPSEVAPPLDTTRTTSIKEANEFLYTGDDPIQKGVDSAIINPDRVVVLSGLISNKDETPLSGVTVTILDHPEFGSTVSRENGRYDIVVNGSGSLVLSFEKLGYLPSQRMIKTEWKNYANVDQIVMIPVETGFTTVDLSGSSQQTTVAAGSVVSDGRGIRQGQILIPAENSANLVMRDGSKIDVESLDLRVTEYTTGTNFTESMPAYLPPTTGYTYAVELSADLAMYLNAKSVEFENPVYYYVDNFLGFPTGAVVPSAYYDKTKAAWVPSDNGVVVEVVDIDAGLAQIDIDGDNMAEDPSVLEYYRVATEELYKIAESYGIGDTFWRVPLEHFSTYDLNYPLEYPSGAQRPEPPEPRNQDDEEARCIQSGSIIHCYEQSLGESIPITGTPYSLNYISSRVRGRKSNYSLVIPLESEEFFQDAGQESLLSSMVVEILVAGRKFEYEFTPYQLFNQKELVFEWDGIDAKGRQTNGKELVTINFKNLYPARLAYRSDDETDNSWKFGGYCDTTCATLDNPDATVDQALTATRYAYLGSSESQFKGTGGWSINVHHVYDPNQKVLYAGNGEKRTVESKGLVISDVETMLDEQHTSVVVATDGNIYYLADTRGTDVEGGLGSNSTTALVKIDQYGTETVVPLVGFEEQSRPCITENSIATSWGRLAAGRDGDIYLTQNYRVTPLENGESYVGIFRIDNQARVERVAGCGFPIDELGDGMKAKFARIDSSYSSNSDVDIAVGKDGALFISQNSSSGLRIRMVDNSGVISTITSIDGERLGSGLADHFARRIDVDRAGNLYVAGYFDLWKFTINGRWEKIADIPCGNWTGGLTAPQTDVAVSSKGDIYTLCSHTPGEGEDVNDLPGNSVGSILSQIDSAGNVQEIAGTMNDEWEPGVIINYDHGKSSPARKASLLHARNLSVAPNGDIYLLEGYPWWRLDLSFDEFREPTHIKKIEVPKADINLGEFVVPSANGNAVYVFDVGGRHLRTEDAITGNAIHSFTYSDDGLLVGIQDRSGNMTVIQRGTDGKIQALVPPTYSAAYDPSNLATQIALNTNGYVERVTNSEGEQYEMLYSESGLLEQFTNPRQKTTYFQYDDEGRLIYEQNPAGAIQELERHENSGLSYTVDFTSGEDVLTKYQTHAAENGDTVRTVTFANQLSNVSTSRLDETTTLVRLDGTTIESSLDSHPRWGMLAPVGKTTTTQPSGLKKTVENKVTVQPEDQGLYGFEIFRETSIENNREFIREYDAATRTWHVTSAQGRQSSVVLDEQGRVSQTVTPGFEPSVSAYDEYGRLHEIRVGSPGQGYRVQRVTYDERGYLQTETTISSDAGEPDLTVTYVRDDIGRVLTKTLPDGRTIQYSYDDNGNLTSITPPGKPAHGFVYDDMDALGQYVPPDVNSGDDNTQYAYNLDKQIDWIRRPDSQVINYVYEGDADDMWGSGLNTDRLSAISLPNGERIEYQYHPSTGNLASLTSPDATDNVILSFSYDGSLPLATTMSGALTGTVSQTYNNDFRVETRSVNGAHSVLYSYDDDGLLESVGDLDLTLSPTTGQLVATALGSTTSDYSYTSFGELEFESVSYDNQNVYAVSYTHDGYGRIKARTETVENDTNTYTYEYEELTGRLDKVYLNGDTDPIADYDYDSNGNRLVQSNYRGATAVVNNGAYDDQDRMTSYGNAIDGYTTYTYTANGELQTKELNGQTTIYDYDVQGNLRQVALPDGTTIEYIVDGLGRRVGKKVNGALEQGFIYKDALNPIAELDGSGAVVSRFVYGTKANVPDYMVSRKADGSTWVMYRIISNHLGSPVLIVNADTGAVAQKISYDEFGVVLDDTNEGFVPFGFAGGLWEPETGLVRFGARDYDSMTGRWTAKDPIRFEGGDTNLYGYSINDPINLIDPSGHSWTEGIANGLIGVGIGLAVGALVAATAPASIAAAIFVAAAGVGGFGLGMDLWEAGSGTDWWSGDQLTQDARETAAGQALVGATCLAVGGSKWMRTGKSGDSAWMTMKPRTRMQNDFGKITTSTKTYNAYQHLPPEARPIGLKDMRPGNWGMTMGTGASPGLRYAWPYGVAGSSWNEVF